jgi:hypothetical protein
MSFLVHSEGVSLLGGRQMDAQVWYAEDGARDHHELSHNLFAHTNHHTTRHREIAIEPRVPQPGAIARHIQLTGATGRCLEEVRLHSQAGAVCVSAKDFEAISWAVSSSDSKGGDGRAVSSKEILRRGETESEELREETHFAAS